VTDAPRDRLILAGASCALVSLPFLAVQFPPVTDLPQHVAQIRLFLEALGRPEGPYVIQWFTPYGLVYLVLGASWLLFAPEGAGRLGMLGIAVLSVGATHLLAAKRQRSPAAATLASILFFSHVVYWGFYPFALGWPVFVLWFLLTSDPRARDVRPVDLLLLPGCAMLLYLSHALWFALGLLWLLVSSLSLRLSPRPLLLRLAAVTPVLVLAGLAYRHLAARVVPHPAVWGSRGLARISAAWLTDAALGGVEGPLEPIVLSAIAGFILLGLWQSRRSARKLIDLQCLVAAALLFTLTLVLPHKYQNTILFAERWMPSALVLALLGTPPPRLSQGLQRAASVCLLAAFCASTLVVWRAFEQTSLAGLPETLRALPVSQRVMGLAFIRSSSLVKPSPFVQTFAYAQAFKGGDLNFSFAEFPHAFVAFKELRLPPWTPALEWFPQTVQASDFAHFDYAIVGGRSDVHDTMSRHFRLDPVTTHGIWRLYRVTDHRPG
jgi:hypothetical protein